MKGAPTLAVKAGSVRVRRLGRSVGGLEVTLPIRSADLRRVGGRTVTLRVGKRTVKAKLAKVQRAKVQGR